MPYVLTILVLDCQFLDAKIIINNVTAAKEREKKWILSTINKKCNHCRHFLSKLCFTHPLISVRLLKSILNCVLSLNFVVFSQKSHLYRILICFSLDFYVWMSPCSSSPLGLPKNLWEWVTNLLSELKLFPLRTFLCTFIAFIMNGDCH